MISVKNFYATLLRKSINTKIGPQISEIAQFEERQADLLLQLIDDKDIVQKYDTRLKESNRATKEVEEYIYLNLDAYANNRGFEYPDYIDKEVKFNGSASCFLANGFPGGSIIEIGEMKFKLPDIKNDNYDNVFCVGQSIIISQESCFKVMILGCAEWGSFSDYIILEYVDGYKEKVPIELSDWWSPTPIYGETIAWTGNCALKTPEGIELRPKNQVHLFSKSYLISGDKNVGKIHLPDGPFHIFAITLGR